MMKTNFPPNFNDYLKEKFALNNSHTYLGNLNTGTRVCCLYRVSTEQQVDHNGEDEPDIPMQRLACHKFCEKMGWTIVHEEQEEGVSGHKVRAEKRDKIQIIKGYALQKEFDILLVFMFDRIGRISDETPFIVEWFARNGIRIWSTQEGEQRFETHNDRLVNYLRFWAADGESEKTSIRTSTRMGQITEEGYFTGGCCPYGYKLVRQGRCNKKGFELYDIVVNEREAPVILLMYRLAASEGLGPQSTANRLNLWGFKNRDGQNWHPSTIRGILKNIMYVGILRSGAYHSDIIKELQIINEELFMFVQELFYQRSSSHERTRRIPRNTRGQSLLAGNVFCGHCGARLSLTTNGKGRPRADGTDAMRIRYVCQTKTRKHGDCDGQTGYTMSRLDRMIDDIIHRVFQNAKHFSKNEILTAGHKSRLSKQTAHVKTLQHEYKKAEKDLQILNAEIVKALRGESDFTPAMLKNVILETDTKRAELESAYIAAKEDLDKNRIQLSDLSSKYDKLIAWSNIYDNAPIETRKMIVSQIIERVDVYRDYKLKIKFKISVEQFTQGLDFAA